MTASSTRRSRLVSSSGAISSKLSTTSKQSQVGGEAIEPEPPEGREYQPVAVDSGPPGLHPWCRASDLGCADFQPIGISKSQVNGFSCVVLTRQYFLIFGGVGPALQPANPIDIRPDVPAAGGGRGIY